MTPREKLQHELGVSSCKIAGEKAIIQQLKQELGEIQKTLERKEAELNDRQQQYTLILKEHEKLELAIKLLDEGPAPVQEVPKTETSAKPLPEDPQEHERILNWLETALIDVKASYPRDVKVGDILRESPTEDEQIRAVRFWRVIRITKEPNAYRRQLDYVLEAESIIEPHNGGAWFKQKYTIFKFRVNPVNSVRVLRETVSDCKTWDEWHRKEYGSSSGQYPKSNIRNVFSHVSGRV